MLEAQKTPDSSSNSKQQQQKKNNPGSIIIPDIKLSYRIRVTKTSLQMYRNWRIDQGSTLAPDFDKQFKNTLHKTSFINNAIGKVDVDL